MVRSSCMVKGLMQPTHEHTASGMSTGLRVSSWLILAKDIDDVKCSFIYAVLLTVYSLKNPETCLTEDSHVSKMLNNIIIIIMFAFQR